MAKSGVDTKIGAKELTAMMTVLTTTQTFLNYPSFVSQTALEAAWMEPLITGAATLLIFLFVERILSKRFPSMDIIEVCRVTFGRPIALLVAFLFAFYFLLSTANLARQFTENVVTTVLSSTPIILVGVLFVVTVAFTAYCGIEAIARTSYLLLPVIIIGILGLCVLTLNWWQPQQLLPFWGAGESAVFTGAIRSAAIFTNVLILCIIYPHVHNPKSLRKVGVVSIMTSTLLLTAFLLAYHMVFPAIQTDKVTFPLYQMARMVYLGRFIQRLESIFIFLWVTAAVLNMAIYLWAGAYTLSSACGWSNFRPSVPSLAVIVFSVSMLWENLMSVMQFDENVLLPWSGLIVFGVPVTIVIFAALLVPLRSRRRRYGRA